MTKPKICIVGPGVVGQGTGKVFALKGFEVAFYGGNPQKTEKLRKEGFEAFGRDELINGAYDFDITMFTVPTPTMDGKIDLTAIDSASKELGKRLKYKNKYHLAVVKSTVPPGTTESLVIKNIEKYSGKKVGKDFGVCMNPEYLREETAFEDSLKPWLIVIGEYDKRSGDLLNEAYKAFDCPVHRTKLMEAEMQKYIHNLYNAAKISFFNEMREVARGFNLDAEKIFKLSAISTEGIWNPTYGIKDKGPFMGSCLPKDTKAFAHWAKKHGYPVKLLNAVIKVNEDLKERLGIANSHTAIGTSL